MIRMIQSTHANHAKKYFSDALAQSDYYVNDQELQGLFKGKLAERLGVSGMVTKEAFFALCDNLHPTTGNHLTPLTREGRITGYDINFHAPKSVSILHVLSNDNHIRAAFEKSVSETMRDIENAAMTRVRRNKVYEDRPTGELIWAEFTHQTARPVADHDPDPHLHLHAFTFNATWDDNEKKYKAAKFRDINREMPYYQACFHKRLSDELLGLGYKIRLTDNSFEVEGVPSSVIHHFSKRSNEIGRIAKEKGITDAKALDQLGAKSRSKKKKGVSMGRLKADWKRQMAEHSEGQRTELLPPLRFPPSRETLNIKAKDCIDFAIKHCFERASVMTEKAVIKTAFRYAMGYIDVSLQDISMAFKNETKLIRIKQGEREYCTTKEVLKEEKRMIHLARQGIGRLTPLYDYTPLFRNLEEQQANAVGHVLTTKDRISIIRGAAGTGKTTLMKEAKYWIEKTGKKVIAVAPTAQAARSVLKEDGFKDAETVAKLLSDSKLQDTLKHQVLLVDEAGLLGTKDMANLLHLATEKKARVILVGDTRQHASVIRGDALRILNTVGNIQTAEVSKIHRQKNVHYRSIVEDLSKGNIVDAFEKLDQSKFLKSYDPLNPHKALVDDFMIALAKRKTALVISPTHTEGDSVTHEIRERFKQKGRIGKREMVVPRLTNLNLTEAEKTDWRNYQMGQVVQFSQNLKKIRRGSSWRVMDVSNEDIIIENRTGYRISLPRKNSNHFDVYNLAPIGLSKGDVVRLTKNGFDKDKKRYNNGMTLKVASISEKGSLILRNAKTKTKLKIDRNFGHIAHAYCVTSHASQGKTVDEVFIAQPASTFAATDMKQFYVSVSRGREAVHIYTDDKKELLEHAAEMRDRQSALELIAGKNLKTSDYIRHKQRSDYINYSLIKPQEKKSIFIRNTIDIEYEPGI